MRSYLAGFRRVIVTGLVFMLPVYVLLAILTRAWTSLSLLGAHLASLFGLKSIMGVGASSVLSGIALLVIWSGCGVLAHVALFAALRSRVDQWLNTYLPGYASYRAMVENKLQGTPPTLPYASGFIKQQNFWRPVFVVEQGVDGYYVVFVPSVPDTTKGSVLLVAGKDVQLVPALSAIDLDASLKKLGAGLLSDHGIQRHVRAL
jgi:uncharacterized membrane protein